MVLKIFLFSFRTEKKKRTNLLRSEMPIDAETRRAIEKKARLFDAAKSRVEERIKSNVKVAIEKLQSAERELLDEVEIEFGENPFSSFLSNEEDHTEEEIRSILSKEIPSNFGPSEESFRSLLKEIESFKSWETKKVNPFDLIPQNLKCTNVTWNTITVTWNTPNSDSIPFYEIELRTSGSKSVYHTTQTQHTFTGLKPETDYHIRVCTVFANGPRLCGVTPLQSKQRKSLSHGRSVPSMFAMTGSILLMNVIPELRQI